MSAISGAQAAELGGGIETCGGCGRDFVRVRGQLVDPRHRYRVLAPDAQGAWGLTYGHPVHTCTTVREGA